MANNIYQAQSTMAKMQKSMAGMTKLMTQWHTQNFSNYSILSQYLQAASGMYNSLAQMENLMKKVYSGPNQKG